MHAGTHSFNIHKRPTLVVDELRSKLRALLRVGAHDVLEQADEIRRVPDLLGVQDDLVRLARLRETCDDLVGNIRAKIDTEGKGEIICSDNVTKLLAACELRVMIISAQA